MYSPKHQFELIGHLVRRDFRLHYTGSVLGVLWSVALPLIQLLVFVFLFGKVVPLDIEDYPAFVFSALLPWTWFSSSVASAAGLFIGNRDLLRRPNFTPATLIVVGALSNLLTYLVSLPILLVMLALHGRPPTAAVLAFPLLVLIQGVLLVGLGLATATMNVFYRDVAHLTNVALSLLFYLLPIFYRPLNLGTVYSGLLLWNPIASLIQAYRDIFFYQRAPDGPSLVFCAAASLIVAAAGYGIYRRQRPHVMDAL
jgi:ABC-type polysaccharide/polyol phosphate export permease